MRITTDLRQSRSRTARHYSIADKTQDCLQNLVVPIHARSVAIATCRISIMGRDAHNDNGDAPTRTGDFGKNRRGFQGRWVNTRMQTHGEPVSSLDWRTRGRFSVSDSFGGANDLLACFGLSINEVIDHYGNVGDSERKMLDLVDVIEDLAPGLLD